MLRDRWLWAFVALALVVRLVAIELTDDYVPRFDATDYVRHADSIAAGDGFPDSQLVADRGPTAFRPPAYPHLLAATFAASGDSIAAARVVNALLGALAVLLLYLVARMLFDVRVARAAAALAALFPPLIYEATALMSEALFVVLVLAFTLALLVARDATHSGRWALLGGVLCGAAALTRSNGILLLVPIAVWALTMPGSLRRQAQLGGLAALGAVLALAPWALRNTLAFDEPVLTSTQSGYGLASVYNDAARADDEFPASYVAPQFRGPYVSLFRQPGMDEAQLDSELRERAIDYLLDNPGYAFDVSAHGALRIADVIDARQEVSLASGGSTVGERALDLARWSTWVMLLSALGGAVALTLRRRWGPAFVWLVPVLMVLPAIPVLAGPRYRAPADPFICLLAAVAAAAALATLAGRGPFSRTDAGPRTPG